MRSWIDGDNVLNIDINGTQNKRSNPITHGVSNPYTIGLFVNRPGWVIYQSQIARITFKKNGSLVADFVPCKYYDGRIGMYEKVSEAFFGNSGTGVFIAGNEK